MIRAKSLIKGAASNFIPQLRSSGPGVTGAFNANGSYAIFRSHHAHTTRS